MPSLYISAGQHACIARMRSDCSAVCFGSQSATAASAKKYAKLLTKAFCSTPLVCIHIVTAGSFAHSQSGLKLMCMTPCMLASRAPWLHQYSCLTSTVNELHLIRLAGRKPIAGTAFEQSWWGAALLRRKILQLSKTKLSRQLTTGCRSPESADQASICCAFSSTSHSRWCPAKFNSWSGLGFPSAFCWTKCGHLASPHDTQTKPPNNSTARVHTPASLPLVYSSMRERRRRRYMLRRSGTAKMASMR